MPSSGTSVAQLSTKVILFGFRVWARVKMGTTTHKAKRIDFIVTECEDYCNMWERLKGRILGCHELPKEKREEGGEEGEGDFVKYTRQLLARVGTAMLTEKLILFIERKCIISC